MHRICICLVAALALAGCSDDDATDDDASGDGGDGGEGAATGAGGTGGGAVSSSSSGGGGMPVDRCPEVCAKMDALFASFGCALEECNCKAPCADLLEANIDCIPAASPDCTCTGSELDCTICEAETAAANRCWQNN